MCSDDLGSRARATLLDCLGTPGDPDRDLAHVPQGVGRSLTSYCDVGS